MNEAAVEGLASIMLSGIGRSSYHLLSKTSTLKQRSAEKHKDLGDKRFQMENASKEEEGKLDTEQRLR